MILVAGGGIAGLVLGLTLNQLGLPFRVFERVAEPKPLGVGINLQPNAVRELFDLYLPPALTTSASVPANTAFTPNRAARSGSNRAATRQAIHGRNSRCTVAGCKCCSLMNFAAAPDTAPW